MNQRMIKKRQNASSQDEALGYRNACRLKDKILINALPMANPTTQISIDS